VRAAHGALRYGKNDGGPRLIAAGALAPFGGRPGSLAHFLISGPRTVRLRGKCAILSPP
jgi:hypothetical protein